MYTASPGPSSCLSSPSHCSIRPSRTQMISSWSGWRWNGWPPPASSITSMTHSAVEPVNDGRLTQPVSPQSNVSRAMSSFVMNRPFMLSPGSGSTRAPPMAGASKDWPLAALHAKEAALEVGIGGDLRGGRLGEDAPGDHHELALGHRRRHGEVLLDDQDRQPVARERLERL